MSYLRSACSFLSNRLAGPYLQCIVLHLITLCAYLLSALQSSPGLVQCSKIVVSIPPSGYRLGQKTVSLSSFRIISFPLNFLSLLLPLSIPGMCSMFVPVQ